MTNGTQEKTKKPAVKKVAVTSAKVATKASIKTATQTAATGKAAAAKPATRKAAADPPAKAARSPIAPEQRRHYIEVAAYYIAERRGFSGASVHQDWVQAEFEIDQLLRAGKLSGC